MKKLTTRSVSVALATLIAGAAMTVAGPTAAQADPLDGTGTWRMQNPTTFKIPANWRCGAAYTNRDNRSIAQPCVIRSGAYVQGAAIIRNKTNSAYAIKSAVYMQNVSFRPVDKRGWTCPPSSMAPRGVSICFGGTVKSTFPKSVQILWNQQVEAVRE